MNVPDAEEKVNLPFLLCLFVPFSHSVGRMIHTHVTKHGSSLLSPWIQMPVSSTNIITDTPEIVFFFLPAASIP
jgi:hypothetical protein